MFEQNTYRLCKAIWWVNMLVWSNIPSRLYEDRTCNGNAIRRLVFIIVKRPLQTKSDPVLWRRRLFVPKMLSISSCSLAWTSGLAPMRCVAQLAAAAVVSWPCVRQTEKTSYESVPFLKCTLRSFAIFHNVASTIYSSTIILWFVKRFSLRIVAYDDINDYILLNCYR